MVRMMDVGAVRQDDRRRSGCPSPFSPSRVCVLRLPPSRPLRLPTLMRGRGAAQTKLETECYSCLLGQCLMTRPRTRILSTATDHQPPSNHTQEERKRQGWEAGESSWRWSWSCPSRPLPLCALLRRISASQAASSPGHTHQTCKCPRFESAPPWP